MRCSKMRNSKMAVFWGLGLAVALFSGCGTTGAQPDPDLGDSSFISADAPVGQDSGRYGEDSPDAEAGTGGDQNERTVEEGDIYRVLGGGLIANFNTYRGLQIIDFNDVRNPKIIGKFRTSGTPVEMYVYQEVAYLLLNNWQGYYASARSSITAEPYYGGMVMAIDLADPENPRLIDQEQVPGWIRTSRLVHGGGQAALYVAASLWQQDASTVVKSFAVVEGALEPRTQIDLGGYVQDIQATPNALLVARYDWQRYDGRSTVAIIDISDPAGTMREGAEVLTAGRIESKFNMDLYKNVLRLVSGASWSGTRTNHLETFDVSDINDPRPIDHRAFGDGEQLFATLFLDNRAFCVTYRQVDPFHTFYIDDAGHIEPHSEFVVSGWNDFFRAVLGGTRLVGIGLNDEQGRTMAVSLYDITDLSNPQPLLARAEVSADHSWSEAQWDDKAFSVIEDAVAVQGPGGVTETGLVLLPFSGYDENYRRYMSGVQIFTFSDRTLTRRGVMVQQNWVRRSFLADDALAANLSDLDMTLFDLSDPDIPRKLAELVLAPNFTDLFDLGSHIARLRWDRDYYWWWGSSAELPPNRLEVVDNQPDIDGARPKAVVEVAYDASLVQVGGGVAEVRYEWQGGSDKYLTTIRYIDLTNPEQPTVRGTLTSDAIEPAWGGYYYPYYPGGPEVDCGFGDCWGGYGYYGDYSGMMAVGQALVIPAMEQEQQLLGVEHVCYTYPSEYWQDCDQAEGGSKSCSYPSGQVTCRSLNGAPEVCTGTINVCTYDQESYTTTCRPARPGEVTTETSCYDHDYYRYWWHYRLQVVDFTDPDRPRLVAVIERPRDEQDVSLLADGSSLWLTYKVPENIMGDPRPYARYFIQRIDLGDPAHPSFGPSINVPGVLQRVDGDIVYTLDTVWGEQIVEAAVNQLRLEGNRAVLLARKRFDGQEVHRVVMDGNGHLLVTHRPSWVVIQNEGLAWDEVYETLSIYGIDEGFRLMSRFEVDNWADLRQAVAGRALFSVPGGLLVVNLDDPTHPFAQAYFPVMGWPGRLLVKDGRVSFAAGPWGIFSFGLDEYNLFGG